MGSTAYALPSILSVESFPMGSMQLVTSSMMRVVLMPKQYQEPAFLIMEKLSLHDDPTVSRTVRESLSVLTC